MLDQGELNVGQSTRWNHGAEVQPVSGLGIMADDVSAHDVAPIVESVAGWTSLVENSVCIRTLRLYRGGRARVPSEPIWNAPVTLQ
jgi:hypothetical protein